MNKKNVTLIIEGSERSGKSTLQRNLLGFLADKKVWPVSTFHHTNFKMSDKSLVQEFSYEYYDNMIKTISDNQTSAIHDRGHISESVFSPMYRNYDGSYVFDIETKYKLNTLDNLFLIYLYDTPKSIMSREDGDSLSTTEDAIQKEIDGFINGVNRSKIKNKLIINIQDFDLNTAKVFAHVAKWLESKMHK